jgi:hypothetical protein
VTAADYPDWSVPQANASSIASTGVPLLSMPNELYNATTVMAAGATTGIVAIPISQPSYEISVNAFQSGAGAAGPLEITATWFDSSGLFNVDGQKWCIWPGTSTLGHIVVGHGPTRASQLVLQYANKSTVMQYSVQVQVFGRSHLYDNDDWRSFNYINTASGGTLATMDMQSTLIGYRALSVGAGATDTTELPLYCGPALLWADTSSAGADLNLTIQNSANSEGNGLGNLIYRQISGANGYVTAELALPRYQCKIALLNSNAAAKTLRYVLHTIEA